MKGTIIPEIKQGVTSKVASPLMIAGNLDLPVHLKNMYHIILISSQNSFAGKCPFSLQLAKKYRMVKVSPILERDDTHGEILANTAGNLIKCDEFAILFLPGNLKP